MSDHSVWLLFGSNIRPEENIRKALAMIGPSLRNMRLSSVYQSPPADGSNQPDYLNLAVRGNTDFSAEYHLLDLIPLIESKLGRVRESDRFAARTIDIDLMLYDRFSGLIAGKVIPHPDITARAFAAIPLAEIDPTYMHPVTGETLMQIAKRFADAMISLRADLKIQYP